MGNVDSALRESKPNPGGARMINKAVPTRPPVSDRSIARVFFFEDRHSSKQHSRDLVFGSELGKGVQCVKAVQWRMTATVTMDVSGITFSASSGERD